MICPHCKRVVDFRVTDEVRAEIIALSKQRYSLRDIEAATGVSYSTAGRILQAEKRRLTSKRREGV